MSGTRIRAETIDLVLREPQEVLTWVESLSDSVKAEISADWLARLRASPSADPWTCGFAMVHRETNSKIGSCAYKSPPDPDGVVEIAYGVDPEQQGRGYATEAARALVAYAFSTGRVRIVCAHTMPEPNASTRVLTKCGFEYLGEVIDPEDGLVWRWEIRPPTVNRATP